MVNSKMITLGGDPEFELYSISNSSKPIAGYEIISDDDHENEIGLDGNSSIVELRPLYTSSPEEYVQNVEILFKRFHTMHSGFRLSTRGRWESLGGHIHVGSNRIDIIRKLRDEADLITRILDCYIGIPTSKMNSKVRQVSSYGNLGDYERKRYGFEYRTPPSAIYYHPELLRIVYTITEKVVTGYLNDTVDISILEKDQLTDEDFIHIVGNEDYEKYITLVNNYEYVREIDYEAWGVNSSNFVLAEVRFRDDWNEQQKREFRNRVIRKLKKNKLANKSMKIVLYGLKSERGFKFAIPGVAPELHLDETYPKETNPQPNEFWFGIPYELRIERLPNDEELELITELVSECIKSNFKLINRRYFTCV